MMIVSPLPITSFFTADVAKPPTTLGTISNLFQPAQEKKPVIQLAAMIPAALAAAKAGGVGLAQALPSLIKPASGLADALGLGLGSLKSSPMNVTQTQSVSQDTNVNISNILGGRTFGNATEDGDFDAFQTLSDVYAIRDAMNANTQSSVVTGGVPLTSFTQSTGLNPLLIGALIIGGVFLLTRRK